jgi:hypothetical protein
MQYYNDKIQIDINVINDIFSNFKDDTKMLVFGLGYDSKMWYEGNNKNTFFVENKTEYIELNKNDIDSNNIIKYDYVTTCKTSINLHDDEIKNFKIPEKILENSPYDIIIIDGPEGYNEDKPGRLIPCYWSTMISKEGSLIYIDDANRKLEDYCIKKFFNNKKKVFFNQRDKCVKIFM